jgi:hypothetical protein
MKTRPGCVNQFYSWKTCSGVSKIEFKVKEPWASFDRVFEIEIPDIVFSVSTYDPASGERPLPNITEMHNLRTKYGVTSQPLMVSGWAGKECSEDTIFEFHGPGLLLVQDDEPGAKLYQAKNCDKVALTGRQTAFLFNLGKDKDLLEVWDISSAAPQVSNKMPSLIIYRDGGKFLFSRNGNTLPVDVDAIDKLQSEDTQKRFRAELDLELSPATPEVKLTGSSELVVFGSLNDAVKPGTTECRHFFLKYPAPMHSNPHGCPDLQTLKAKLSGRISAVSGTAVTGRPMQIIVPHKPEPWFRTVWPPTDSRVEYVVPPIRNVDGAIIYASDGSCAVMANDMLGSVPLILVEEPVCAAGAWADLAMVIWGQKQRGGTSEILVLDYYRYYLVHDANGLAAVGTLTNAVRELKMQICGMDRAQMLFHMLAIAALFGRLETVHAISWVAPNLTFSIEDRETGFPIICTAICTVECLFGEEVGRHLFTLIDVAGKTHDIPFRFDINCYDGLVGGWRAALPDAFAGTLSAEETYLILGIMDRCRKWRLI